MRALLVEDDPDVGADVEQALRAGGFVVDRSRDGEDAWFRGDTEDYDLCVLDLGLPRMHGFEVLRKMRGRGSSVPVLILTAADSVEQRVKGLDLGADDYMAKPFSFDELQARLRALTRRVRPPNDEPGAEVLSFSDLSLDLQTREVTRGSRRISLTRTEFALLQTFLENPRRVLERSWLLNEVWGFDFPTTANSLEVYIGYLRRKTEGEGETRLIHTVRGIGYVLRETPP